MAPPHVCVGRWNISMNGTKKHKHYISNTGEKVRLTNMLVSFVFFLLGFVISIARWVVWNIDLGHFFMKSFTWLGDSGLFFMHSVISCKL